MSILRIGADPEVFVTKRGHFISGHEFPCGTKKAPRLLKSGSVQVDGMALEFNVIPSTTRQDFIDNTMKVYGELRQIVKETDPEASLMAIPTVDFGTEYMETIPKEAKELGCNPDFNAWTGLQNSPPDGTRTIRTGAGHIHVGFVDEANADVNNPEFFDLCCDAVKEMDYFVGLPSLIWDGDQRRRELYGRGGAFRPKPYGFEYRSLSNAWLQDPKTMALVFDQTQKCMTRFFNEKKKPLVTRFGSIAEDLINKGDSEWSKKYQKIAHEVFA